MTRIDKQLEGLQFAKNVESDADRWQNFGVLMAKFEKLDPAVARGMALTALRGTGDGKLASFAQALEDATKPLAPTPIGEPRYPIPTSSSEPTYGERYSGRSRGIG